MRNLARSACEADKRNHYDWRVLWYHEFRRKRFTTQPVGASEEQLIVWRQDRAG